MSTYAWVVPWLSLAVALSALGLSRRDRGRAALDVALASLARDLAVIRAEYHGLSERCVRLETQVPALERLDAALTARLELIATEVHSILALGQR